MRYLAALSHAFSIAMREWGWTDDNPLRKVSKPKEPRGRVRFLDDGERDGLLHACRASDSSLLYPIVVLAIATGMRRGELMHLSWRQIDFTRNRITLHETKNGERHAVPLVGLARELIHELHRTLARGTVYVARPESHLVVRADRTPGYTDGARIRFLRSAADPLFDSASKVFGADLTAVVLTGGDSDVTDGVRSVKKSGGYVIAQDPDTSDVDEIPQSAIDTGCVDRVLPLHEIAGVLIERVKKHAHTPSNRPS